VKDSARLYAVLTTLNSSKLELVASHFLASVRLNMPFNKVTVQMTAELTIKGDVEEVEISSSAALKMKDNVNSGRVRSSGNI
jgi:phage gp45-like